MRRRPAPTTDTRSPDERLEALVREDNNDRRERMIMRIREGLEASPETIGAWLGAARTLADRLIIGEDAYWYLAYLLAECALFAASSQDEELVQLGAEVDAIEEAHGLTEDETFHDDDAPEDWTALNEAWGRRADAVIADVLRASGHVDVADALLNDRAAFERRTDKGYEEIWGEEPED